MSETMRQIPLFQETFCFVCGRPVDMGQGVYIGQGRWRHGKCGPGSKKWLRSERAVRSGLRHLFVKNGEEENQH